MRTAYINIGSNRGDRAALIERAVVMTESALGAAACRAPLYQSPAWGYDSPNPFLNLGITIATGLAPAELLERLQDVERSISAASHRDTTGQYVDRDIDIDLISVDDVAMETPALTLPHPRMHLRRFVLVPMACLLPGWRHPATGLTPAAMLRVL